MRESQKMDYYRYTVPKSVYNCLRSFSTSSQKVHYPWNRPYKVVESIVVFEKEDKWEIEIDTTHSKITLYCGRKFKRIAVLELRGDRLFYIAGKEVEIFDGEFVSKEDVPFHVPVYTADILRMFRHYADLALNITVKTVDLTT